MYWPEKTVDLVELDQEAKAEGVKLWLIGRGSNLLAPDEGLPGITVVTTCLTDIAWSEDFSSREDPLQEGDTPQREPDLRGKTTVRVGAGYALAKLAQEAGERGLSGLEFARGIPGTLGGAVIMNAGAHGGEISKRILRVKALVEGDIREFRGEELAFSYRKSSLKDRAWVLEAELVLIPGKREAILQTMQENLLKRAASQPLEWPNAGSVFRNPPGDFAARLIEAAGWKGKSRGGAQVSEKHSNFIVNTGEARAEDVLFLIRSIRADVREHFAVELQPEIRYLGREVEAER